MCCGGSNLPTAQFASNIEPWESTFRCVASVDENRSSSVKNLSAIERHWRKRKLAVTGEIYDLNSNTTKLFFPSS